MLLKVRTFLSIILSSDLTRSNGKIFSLSVLLLFGSIDIGNLYLFIKPILIVAIVGFNCCNFSSTA
jgi:hypothetical protein